jgi:hypothetical protein
MEGLPMLASLIADAAYLMSAGLCGMAWILILGWVLHFVPGWRLNRVRRFFFRFSRPLLQWGEAHYPLRFASLEATPILLAVLLLALCRYGVPWLVLLSFAIRG